MRKLKTGEKIGILAKKKKINLHKLAHDAGIPYNTLYSIVRRKSDNVELDTVRKIALALDVHPIEIYGKNALELIEYGMDLLQRVLDEKKQRTETIHAEDVATESELQVKISSFTASPVGISIIHSFYELNELGQQEASERLYELTEIPKYQRTEPLESPTANESKKGVTIPGEQEKPPEGKITPNDGK